MSISKKIRFEVFKRDGFRCAYCGRTPPEVVLEIDHVDPKFNKGSDSIDNLLSSCFDCNRGKKHIPLDKIPSTLSENIAVIREREEQIGEHRKLLDSIERRIKKDIREVCKVFNDSFPKYTLNTRFRLVSIRKFLKHLPKNEVVDAMRQATMKRHDDRDAAAKYFCGICWQKIKGDDRNGSWRPRG
jgi:hypothetical protein